MRLLQERGNGLRRPQSEVLGEGLFELRGKEVRIFYMFLENRVMVRRERGSRQEREG